jgi:competence ComEA-like helix-hairpin-helix protein
MSKPKHDFNLPRRARLGAIVLLIVLLIAVVIWRVIPSFMQPKTDKEEAALQQAWSKFEKERPEKSSYPKQQQHYYSDKEDNGQGSNANAVLFPFNPNTASEEELLKMGLPKYTVRTILKYRAGRPNTFKKKEDLQRLYTLRKEDYKRIAPYINIPESNSTESYANKYERYSKNDHFKDRQEPKIIELNAATADELMSLKGIGPGYSKRIINYRDALGGFLRVDQLTEVYGFPDSVYQQLKEKFIVDVTLVKHINVNIADEEALAKVPYIGRRMALNIIKLRNGLKEFKEIEQLRQVPLINEEKYRKIAPYLSTH